MTVAEIQSYIQSYLMVESAWMAVEHHPYWKAQFERLAVRIGKKKAIVAIARKLLVVVWHVLILRRKLIGTPIKHW